TAAWPSGLVVSRSRALARSSRHCIRNQRRSCRTLFGFPCASACIIIPALAIRSKTLTSCAASPVVARALVRKRELREQVEPSNPRMAGGANVQPLLIAGPYRPPSPEQVACDIRTERVSGAQGLIDYGGQILLTCFCQDARRRYSADAYCSDRRCHRIAAHFAALHE